MQVSSQSYSEPDVEYTQWIRYDTARRRTEIGTQNGTVRWFVVRLEYNANANWRLTGERKPAHRAAGAWLQVVGFDHHPATNWGHDITEERLHLDVYRDGRKYDIKRGFPPVALNDAPHYCEQFIDRNAEFYVDRFERWHDL